MINKHRLVKLTKKVLSINSENPPGNELGVSKFIEHDMRSLGLKVDTYSFAKGRPNVVAILKGSLKRNKASKEAVLITPHVDTVPIGEGWRYDPLGSKVISGRIYGRGASDDKGNLACCMEVMRSLVEDGVSLKRDVIMAATVDEETGSRYGIFPLLEKKILSPSEAVILDSTEYDAVVAQKGLFHCRVQIFGKKAHGAYNWRGVNAIELASEAIVKIKKHKFNFRKHPLLNSPTINVGLIKGGVKINVVADFCEFALDIRFLPGMTSQGILRQLRNIIKGVTGRFKIIVDDVQQPYEIDKKHTLVNTYMNAAKKLKIKASLKGSEGATVLSFFKKYHIPAFATGYGAHGTAHTTDEYIRADTLYKGAQLLEQFLKNYDAR